jgi:hypothetical protein
MSVHSGQPSWQNGTPQSMQRATWQHSSYSYSGCGCGCGCGEK